jgi:hypothetical protein
VFFLGKNGGDNMNYKYNWTSFPKHTINLGALCVPADIIQCFKKYNIDKYVYCIMFKGTVIKFGMSAPESYTREWGERVYRQIGHCYSWGKNVRLEGSSGADWLIIERDFKNLYGIDLDHKQMKLIVWDVTNYHFQSFQPFKEVEAMESELINNYLEQFGEKPIGNINDESNKRHRSFVSKETFGHLFAEENDNIFIEE